MVKLILINIVLAALLVCLIVYILKTSKLVPETEPVEHKVVDTDVVPKEKKEVQVKSQMEEVVPSEDVHTMDLCEKKQIDSLPAEEISSSADLPSSDQEETTDYSFSPSLEWKCTCGRIHPNYIHQCTCGRTRE